MKTHLPLILSAAALLAACVMPVPGEPFRLYDSIEVDGTTYTIEAQQHVQRDALVGGGTLLGEQPFDLYFVTVGDRRVECGTVANAPRSDVLRACENRIRAALAPEDDDDDDDGYSVPDD